MDKQQCANRIVELFPEYEVSIKEHILEYGEILLHILSSEVIHEPLIMLLQFNKKSDLIQKYCSLIEEMWRTGTDEVVNVVEVSILERLSDDAKIWQRFGRYISEDFRTYVNEEVLTGNAMMAGVEKLEDSKCQKTNSLEHTSEFAKIYNSANHLYPKEKRYPVTEAVFEKQLREDVNYLYQKDGKNVAFFSYHEREKYVELTSLYVEYEYQRMGIGEELLSVFEQLFPIGTLFITKALKDSPWAIRFYKKHGFLASPEEIFQIMQYKEKTWEIVLYKIAK